MIGTTSGTLGCSSRCACNRSADPPWFLTSPRLIELLGYKWFLGRKQREVGTARDYLYLIIRDALQNGVFDRLRMCPRCKKFFVADDARQRFCSNEHRNEFNNKKRLEEGYFKRLRKGKRRRELVRARKLQSEGESPTEIRKQTGLPLRVLKREGVIP